MYPIFISYQLHCSLGSDVIREVTDKCCNIYYENNELLDNRGRIIHSLVIILELFSIDLGIIYLFTSCIKNHIFYG